MKCVRVRDNMVTIKIDKEQIKELIYHLSSVNTFHELLDELAKVIGGWEVYNNWVDEYETKLYGGKVH